MFSYSHKKLSNGLCVDSRYPVDLFPEAIVDCVVADFRGQNLSVPILTIIITVTLHETKNTRGRGSTRAQL